jgi:hypothetical protein
VVVAVVVYAAEVAVLVDLERPPDLEYLVELLIQ